MIRELLKTFFYDPFYNGVVFLIALLPTHDVGIAVIAFTVLVKVILFPLSQKSIRTQILMREIDPELKKLREQYKDNPERQARETFALYKEKKISPFSSFALLLIQIPIVLGLYFVFLRGGLPAIDLSTLYGFVMPPEAIRMTLFGVFDISGKSIILAGLAGITQFFQARLLTPVIKKKKDGTNTLKDDIAHSMNIQMRYVMPIIIAFIAYTLSAVVALYWVVNNILTILQELLVRRMHRKEVQSSLGPNEETGGIA